MNRAKSLIVNPKPEWALIKGEVHTKEETMNRYAIPLIAFMALCSILGSAITVANMGYAIIKAILVFFFNFGGMYVSAYIINELTTSFNSKKSLDTTFKLVVYSFTAYFIVLAIVLLWPPLSLLTAIGFFSVYLYWEGTSILLEIPDDNKAGFVVVSSLVIIGIYAILNLIMEGILNHVFGIGLLG